ncbi:MAG: tRNA pseudouridine(38-40) synthase TruA [Nitrolancea sp.]
MSGDATVRHVRIELGYDGTDFYGSQRQASVRTVQQVVEDALKRLTGSPVKIDLAGRTDRGVHAVGQVASATIRWRRDEESLRYALDSLTPEDVSIRSVNETAAGFHARFDARSREYRFRVWNGATPLVLMRRYTWSVRQPLDVTRMNEAAAKLIGRQDFASFAGAGLGVPGSPADCTREMATAEWSVSSYGWERGSDDERLLEFRVQADRFLPHMIRNIVGNLVEVGRGARSVEWFANVLASRDRRAAPAGAPPQGLILWSVEYPTG